MNKNVNDILLIDQEIGKFIEDSEELNDDEFDDEFEKRAYITKAISKLNKISSEGIIELIKRCEYLWDFVDVKTFIKKYPIKKKYLKMNNDMYIEEYRKLKNICYTLNYITDNKNELFECYDKLNVYDTEIYLLKNMPNDQLYCLSNDTGVWDEKLYIFSFFKK